LPSNNLSGRLPASTIGPVLVTSPPAPAELRPLGGRRESRALKVDYDEVASTYPARYAQGGYPGVETTVDRLAAGIQNIVDVGCGTGHWVGRLLNASRWVIGIDPSVEMLRRAPRPLAGHNLIRGCAEALPLANGQFGLVLVVNAVHHFASLGRFVREAARVLRPGGTLGIIGLDPSTGTDRWYVYDYFPLTRDLDRQRYPSSAVISDALHGVGFEHVATAVAQHIIRSEQARRYLETGHLHRHVTSQLSLLNNGQFEEGVRRIWADIREREARGESLKLSADLRLYVTEGRLPESQQRRPA
jgi:ubiquinone/menaquinone biosynthesis C-methylase UbiE